MGGGGVEFLLLFRPQESVRPAAFKENADCDLGMGGTGMSLRGFSFDFRSSPLDTSVDEGAVDAALRRDELSVVDAVFVFDAPLPLFYSQSHIHTNLEILVVFLHFPKDSPICMNYTLEHILFPMRCLRPSCWIPASCSF
jgi:hypothetical protein